MPRKLVAIYAEKHSYTDTREVFSKVWIRVLTICTVAKAHESPMCQTLSVKQYTRCALYRNWQCVEHAFSMNHEICMKRKLNDSGTWKKPGLFWLITHIHTYAWVLNSIMSNSPVTGKQLYGCLVWTQIRVITMSIGGYLGCVKLCTWYKVELLVVLLFIMIPTGSSSVLVTSTMLSSPSMWMRCGTASTGLWTTQKEESNAGEFWQPLLTRPGRPLYSIYPAWVAEHTARWFFMFPSSIIASAHPGFAHLCSVKFRIDKVMYLELIPHNNDIVIFLMVNDECIHV